MGKIGSLINKIGSALNKNTTEELSEEVQKRLNDITELFDSGKISKKDAKILSKYALTTPSELIEQNYKNKNQITIEAIESLKDTDKDLYKAAKESLIKQSATEKRILDPSVKGTKGVESYRDYINRHNEFNVKDMAPEELDTFLNDYKELMSSLQEESKLIEGQRNSLGTNKGVKEIISENVYGEKYDGANKDFWKPKKEKEEFSVKLGSNRKEETAEDIMGFGKKKQKENIPIPEAEKRAKELRQNMEEMLYESPDSVNIEYDRKTGDLKRKVIHLKDSSTAESIAKNKIKENGGFFSKPMIGGAITLGSIAGVYGFVSGGDQAEKRGSDLGGQVAGSLAGTALYGAGVGGASLGVMSAIKGFKGIGVKV